MEEAGDSIGILNINWKVLNNALTLFTVLHDEALDSQDKLQQITELLNGEDIDVNFTDKYDRGNTLLHGAVYYGFDNVVKHLLERNADVNIQNEEGETPLHIAVARGYDNIVQLFLCEKNTDVSQLDADVNVPEFDVSIQNIKGETPLKVLPERQINTHGCGTPTAQMRLGLKVDMNLKNCDGKTPLELANEKKSPAIIAIFESYENISSLVEETPCQDLIPGPTDTSTVEDIDTENNVEQVIDIFDTCPEAYTASGAKLSIHGTVYQLCLLMLFAIRALVKGYRYHLGTEVDEAGKFDDLVFKYQFPNRPTDKLKYLYLQAKSKLDITNDKTKISLSNLLEVGDKSPFSLLKYYKSYVKIKKSNLQEADAIDFAICTNTLFNFYEPGVLVGNGKKLSFELVTDSYEGFFKEGQCYKLVTDEETLDWLKLDFEQKLEKEQKKLQTEGKNESLNEVADTLTSLNGAHNMGRQNLKTYFNKLVFVVGQTANVELVKVALRDYSNKNISLDTDLLTDAFYKQMFDWSSKKEGEWLSNKKVTEIICNLCEKVHTFASFVSQIYAEKLLTSPIVFNLGKLDELRKRIGLPENKIIHLITPMKTELTLLLVAQVLEHNLSYKAHDSFIFMHLSSLLHSKTQESTILAFRTPCNNNLLVIDCLSEKEDRSSNELTALGDTLGHITANNDGKKLILIAPEHHALAVMFKSHNGYNSKEVRNIFQDFTTKTQDMLFTRQITFQGQPMLLNQVIDKKEIDILEIVPIETLIADEGLVIGTEIPISTGYNGSYYIDRFVRYQTAIKPDIFNGKSNENFNDELATTEPEFQHLCALNPKNNIHLIKKQDDRFIWVKSHGKLSALRPYIDNDNTQKCSEKIFVDYVKLQRVVIISDSAGMGKSTVLDHISKKIKETDQGTLVLRIDLNKHTKVLAKSKKEGENKIKELSAMDFLLQLLLMRTPLEKVLLEQKSNTVLMFDGFDEICPDYKTEVLDLIQILKEATKAQIWITTRSYMKEELENTFNTFSYTLEPFSKKDQEDFLIKYWKHEKEINDPDEGEIRAYASSLCEQLSTSISDKEREFTGIPLQMRMLAECFVDDFRKPADFKNDFSLVDLYEKFSRKKFKIFQKEKNEIDYSKVGSIHSQVFNLYMKQHRWYALSVVFSEETADIFIPNYKRLDDIESVLNMIGIVSIINGVPHFIHRTFAEYEVAVFCIKLLKTMDSLKFDVRDFIISDLLISGKFTVIRSFIDGLFASNTCTRAASRKLGTLIAPFSKALVNNKIEEIKKVFLQTAEEGNLNVFKYLLDCVVAQQEILRKFLECTESNSNKTMLHLAAENNNTRFVEKFLNWTHENMELGQEILKVTLSAVDYFGNTALLSASWKRNNDVVCSLLQWTHQNKALGQDIVKQMLLSADITGNTALLVASERGNLTMVTTLLQWTLDNMDQGQDILEQMLLSFDSLQGHKSLQAASWLGNNDVVKTLLQWTRYKLKNGQGLVNQMLLSPDNNGLVALMAASRQGNNDVVQTLLQWTCSNMDDGQIIVKQMLLKPDNNDITALLAASRHGNINVVLELLQWSFDNLDQGPNVVKEMLLKSDKNGITALVTASTQKHYDVVQRLLQWAHDKMSQEVVEQMLFSADNNGVTTFLAASKQSNKDEVQKLLQWTNDKMQQGQEIVRQMLLSADSNGDTALLSAASLGNNDVVQTLLQWTLGNRNQDQDLVKQMLLSTNNNGLTALLAASGQGNNDVVQTIMQWTLDHMAQGQEIYKQMLIKVKK